MSIATLKDIEQLIDQLTPLEQARLLEYLTPRIVQAVATRPSESRSEEEQLSNAWARFFQVGDNMAATDRPDMPTLTQTVQMMRR